MEKQFMLDIETTGSADDCGIIQIGILECIKNSEGYWVPARTFVKLINSDVECNDWVKKNNAKLVELSRETPFVAAPVIRAEILAFFQQCKVPTPVQLIGRNVGTFDYKHMARHGYLTKDDVHYRMYELSGVNKFIEDVTGMDSRTVYKKAQEACDWIDLPEGGAHDALYDCVYQLKTLNGLIKMART